MAGFHTTDLIAAVEERPSLYDASLPEYSNRQLRNHLWREVCENLLSDWNDMDDQEQKNIGAEVQKRWKSLRDCYRRELIIMGQTPTGNAKKKKKYTFFEQLHFLLPSIEHRRPLPPNTRPQDPIEFVELEQAKSPPSIRSSTTPRPIRPKPVLIRRKRSFEEDASRPTTQIPERHSLPNDDVDDDKMFLLSLLPMMKKFDEGDKLMVRVEIMNTIRKAQSELQNQHAQNSKE